MEIMGKHYHHYVLKLVGFTTKEINTNTQPIYEWTCSECGEPRR